MYPIVGSEEIAAGRLTRAALRWNYTAIHPNVYHLNGAARTADMRTRAAWLWAGRRAIIAGRAAARRYGASWAVGDAPIELIGKHRKPVRGVVIRDERIAPDEISPHCGMLMTTAARTAFDLARHLPRTEALPLLDVLSAESGVTVAQVEALIGRYPRARGLPAARQIVKLMDGGARSPEESTLRLALIDWGLPRPTTDIWIEDRFWSTRIAMGWEWARVGVSVQPAGPLEDHSAVQRLKTEELIQRLGWVHIRAHPRRPVRSVLAQAREALRTRGRGGRLPSDSPHRRSD
ncbi:hypothetical protein NIIDNTM18_09520 [Mycolicibacterium litorale]|uniref:Cullin, a subunit of E3 ubiquitin ligase n=1 Tax=Mycolicibacterium litorale TaxID=758802 RepID=A0A6S6NYW8_9MYCO|nr:hypothetical protein [Mycolicibacterium litorale]BCI51674.1 hypothetical protein NIIDNTM18_09520 [Mycolicibacterium litorale]